MEAINMPKNNKIEGLNEAELQQRQNAARSHGVFALRDRGEAALDEAGRSRYAELKGQVNTRSGALELLKEHAAREILMFEIAMSYIASKKDEGVDLGDIAIYTRLPAFMNTASRTIKDLIGLLPDDRDVIDEVKILNSLKDKPDETD